ncbi:MULTISPECIES: hypothetical protein [Novosphingobium]|uniref:Uncharacterized protein n=1 Tax=Novosphingobium pentaromativorans TaxID=205844 RepID=A0A2W5NP99_9SPHN|nr:MULTISPECIES: hypothetical protein [Novosphingobium]PZQ54308.1 MAG: hypothetical protein DI555_12815 [Novosphingobium pentaromativorans]GFE74711.1 hypothetical protein NTCA1_23600 [Novosphingobium sp. TCA1]
MTRPALLIACAMAAVAPSMATAAAPDFFAAALCQPPYSTASATELYEAAEKLAEPDTSSLGAAIYRLPAPVERDGFTAQDVVFAGMSVGVLLEGQVAAKVAERYGLSPETSHLFGSSTAGFARLLPDEQQGMKDLGLISIVAREGPAMPGKTLLTCEFVSNEDRAALEAYEKTSP